ncbi:restriction endonuclease [Acetobacter sp. DsW_54]|uniref:restriction endonuclease n=1 Tax=Acetobacter sp. DsW_54 TaxID=1670660 RepID=UPI00130251D7|nr:restriction endonuclease [Acetobacter sp. DsW_54]
MANEQETARSPFMREREFARLIANVFRAHGFQVQEDVKYRGSASPRRVDLLLTSEEGAVTVGEVKLYRSRMRYIPDENKVISQVRSAQAAFGADHALVVTNLYREALAPSGTIDKDVLLIGIDDLAQLAIDPKVREAIGRVDEELSSALREFDGGNLTTPKKSFELNKLKRKAIPPPLIEEPSAIRYGAKLKAELLEIKTGSSKKQKLHTGRENVNWRLFEDVCYEALQYVFEGVFGSWKTQKSIAGNDNRFDAIAKIQGSDVFCRTLIEHFSTRHILFEFKNYTDAINANLIYITEKYLYTKALRGVAVIISPKGFDSAAKRSAQGALRDVGKVMLDLDVPLLCRLLDARDNAEPPGAEMEILLDTFLMEVGR